VEKRGPPAKKAGGLCEVWPAPMMPSTISYTAVIREDGSWWIGWVEEVPVVKAQEASSIPSHTEINELLALKKGSRFISAMTRK